MKKAYEKPDIIFENFSLSTNIAAGCEKIATSGDGCGFQFGDYIVFKSGSECTYPVTEGNNMFNNICYHNPSADSNLFNS